MAYKCEILADSISEQGHRLTTFKLTYPRIIHAELMTHRLFSRNAASSRAIPVRKMIESIRNNMFTPLAIQKAHKGMQGSDYFEGVELEQAKQLWIESAELAIQQAEKMGKFGISKQIVNRVVEPYQYYQVLVTATEWDNFFKLRCPKYIVNNYTPIQNKTKVFYSRKDVINFVKEHGIKSGWESCEEWDEVQWHSINNSQAEIHIQKIAEMMFDCYNDSKPKTLQSGQWHIPYEDNIGQEELMRLFYQVDSRHPVDMWDLKLKIATARAARISYTTLGDNPKIDYEADIKLHDRLLESKHASPFEHIAQCRNNSTNYANFIGWESYRSILNL